MKNFFSQTWVTSALVVIAIVQIAFGPTIKEKIDEAKSKTDNKE